MTSFVRTYAEYASDAKPYSASDTITLADTAAILQGLTPAQISQLGTDNVDFIDSTDDFLALTVAQYLALGSVALHPSDFVFLADTGSNIAAMTPTEVATLQI